MILCRLHRMVKAAQKLEPLTGCSSPSIAGGLDDVPAVCLG